MLINQLIELRAAKQAELDTILAAAEAETRDLSEDEGTAFDGLVTEIQGLDERINKLAETEDRNRVAGEVAAKFGPAAVRVKSEPTTYRKGGEHSYFKDLFFATKKNDTRAMERLLQNDKENRALSTTAGAGGEFAPPLWVVDEYVKLFRAGRPTADIVSHQPLPTGVSSINLPKIATGTTTAVQASQNTAASQTDLTTTSVTDSVHTIAGTALVSLQELEQSAINFDEVILTDLAADYAAKLDQQVLSGTGSSGQTTGLFNVSGINTVTYSATFGNATAAGVYSKIADAIQRIHTLRFAPPTHIVMHPRRWAWFLAAVDSQNRPLVVPTTQNPYNVMGVEDRVGSIGPVGTLQGLPVIVDANVPTNLNVATPVSTEDEILVLKADDAWLYEGTPKAEAFEQTYAANVQVLVRFYNYFAFLPRYATSISVVTGNGLYAPTF